MVNVLGLLLQFQNSNIGEVFQKKITKFLLVQVEIEDGSDSSDEDEGNKSEDSSLVFVWALDITLEKSSTKI